MYILSNYQNINNSYELLVASVHCKETQVNQASEEREPVIHSIEFVYIYKPTTYIDLVI